MIRAQRGTAVVLVLSLLVTGLPAPAALAPIVHPLSARLPPAGLNRALILKSVGTQLVQLGKTTPASWNLQLEQLALNPAAAPEQRHAARLLARTIENSDAALSLPELAGDPAKRDEIARMRTRLADADRAGLRALVSALDRVFGEAPAALDPLLEGGPAPVLFHLDGMDPGMAERMILRKALKTLPGRESARFLRVAAVDGTPLDRKTSAALERLEAENPGSALSRFLRGRRVSAALDGLFKDGPARDGRLRRLWTLSRELVSDSLDRGTRVVRTPARSFRWLEKLEAAAYNAFRWGTTYVSPERAAWLDKLGAALSEALPGVDVDVALTSQRSLFSSMDRGVPLLAWKQPGFDRVRVRVHRMLLASLFSVGGGLRLSDLGWESADDAIAPLVHRLKTVLTLTADTTPVSNRPYTVEEAEQSLANSPGGELGQMRLFRVAAAAAARNSLFVQTLKVLFFLSFPALPFLVTVICSAVPLADLLLPPAGLSVVMMLGAGALFYISFVFAPKLYNRAIAAGWVAGGDKNAAYPLLLGMPTPLLAAFVPIAAFCEELIFRLPLFAGPSPFKDMLAAAGMDPSFFALLAVSLLCFAVAHLPNFVPHRWTLKTALGTMLYFILMGLLLTGIYWAAGLLVAGLLHTVHNGYLAYREKTSLRSLRNFLKAKQSS